LQVNLKFSVSARMFEVMEEHTAITRGPVREGSRV
jgi:hypothetical protein